IAAVADLDAAVVGGAPAGYVRLFLDEGLTVLDLLGAVEAHHEEARLLLAVAEPQRAETAAPAAEALSARELEVLRLLATDLTGPEIAGRLFMSVNTFRTHSRHIFTKLDVNTRRAAVRRAGELRLS
ncbi:MAG: helix-turn-helix transcriptional regulator, partial [Nocardioidaceae bacterium]|nr:helix-turn-helix transcriptional regulator [Nocardioidaceae bacterium]